MKERLSLTALFLTTALQGCSILPQLEMYDQNFSNTGITDQEQLELTKEFYDVREEMRKNGTSEEDFELLVLQEIPDEEIEKLPLVVLADLMTPLSFTQTLHSMSNDSDKETYNVALAKLHQKIKPSSAFSTWDLAKKIELVDALVTDEFLINTRDKWDELSREEKMGAAWHVANIQASIYADGNHYGIKTFGKVHINKDLEGTNTGGSYGRMGGLEVNPVMLDKFSRIMEWVLHEQYHIIQRSITGHFSSGEMSVNDPFYYDAMVLHSSVISNFELPSDGNPTDMARYKESPMEAGAYKLQGYWQFVGAGADIFEKDERLGAYRKKMDEKYAEFSAQALKAKSFAPEGDFDISDIQPHFPVGP